MIDNAININLFINFHAVEFLFDATKTVNRRYNNFFHMNSLLITMTFLIFESKIELNDSVLFLKGAFDKLRRKIAIFLIII